jgi:hypothetical protein
MNVAAKNAVIEHEHEPGKQVWDNHVRSVTPMDMLDRALASGASLDMVEKLMALQDRWEDSQAKKAFSEAFAAFKSEAVTIVRNKKVTDGPLKGKSYAELFSFVDAVTPALSKHGLSASWAITRDEKDWIEVTCTIEHVKGHARRVSMGGPPDAGGAKNQIQARASTVTYLERHTLKAACGLAEQGDDPDGHQGKEDKGPISGEQAEVIRKLINDTGTDIEKFCRAFKIEAVPELPAGKFDTAIARLSEKANSK